MKHSVLLPVFFVLMAIQGCGKKEAPAALASAPATAPAQEPPKVQSTQDIVCALAPSQSAVVSSVSGALGGAGATALALAQATGLSVVAHSSGYLILTGSGGYIAGTLGAGAIAGPIIVAVGLVVGGTAVSVELLCAPKNHAGAAAKINAAAEEFMRRSRITFVDVKTSAASLATKVSIKTKAVAGDVYEYAYRK